MKTYNDVDHYSKGATYLSEVVSTVRAFSCNLTILKAFLLHLRSPPACSHTTMLPQLVAVRALGD